MALEAPASMALLVVFWDVMDRKNGAMCSHKALSEILGVSTSTIKRAIKTLKDRGFISVLKTGQENIYAVNHSIVWKNSGGKMWMSKFNVGVAITLNEQEQEVKRLIGAATAEKSKLEVKNP